METRSSVLSDLRAKNKENNSTQSSQQSLAATIGIFASIAFIVMMVMDRPNLLLWAIGIAAVIFIAKLIYSSKTKKQICKAKVNFESIRNHQISRYAEWLKGLHLGHDQSIDKIVRAVNRDLKLASPKKFLGAHLISGPKGTGKTQLIHLIGQVLFGKTNIIEFDFKSLDQGSFTGLFLDMLERVSENPHQLIVLENVDSMPSYMLEPFLDIFKTNQWLAEEDDVPTSFSGCLFLVTVGTPIEETELVDFRLISFCNETISWGQLPYSDIAKIASLQILEYWKTHSIQLDFVSPEAVLQILKENKPRSNLGMHPYPQMIRNKSARALEQVLGMGHKRTKIDIDETGCFKIKGAA